MAGIHFDITSNNTQFLKSIEQIQKACNHFVKKIEEGGAGLDDMFSNAAKAGVNLEEVLKGNEQEVARFVSFLEKSFKEVEEAYERMSDDMKETSIGKALQQSVNEAKVMTEEMTEQMNGVARSRKGMSMEITQVLREIPNLAYGFPIFVSSLSNNLPMLADAISRVKAENDLLTASGGKAVPVWKTVVKSLFSWQTALIGGITLLVMYSEDITEWVKKIAGSNEAILSSAEAIEELNDALGEGTDFGKKRADFELLRKAYADLGGDVKKQEKFLLENKSAFDELGVSISNITDLDRLFIDQGDAFIKSLDARTRATAATKLAAEEYEKAFRKQIEIDNERISASDRTAPALGAYSFGAGGGGLGSGSAAIAELQEKEAEKNFQKRKKRLEAEQKAIETNAAKFIELANKAQKEAEELLSGAGIKTGGGLDNKYLADVEKYQTELNGLKLKAQKVYNDKILASMNDGYAKQLQTIKNAYSNELAELDKYRQNYINKKKDLIGNGALSQEETEYFKSWNTAITENYEAKLSEFHSILREIKDAYNVEQKSTLKQELDEIDKTYAEELDKLKTHDAMTLQEIEAFESMKSALILAWEHERQIAISNDRLRINSQEMDSKLMDTDLKFYGVGLTEVAEQKKLEIVIQYSKERIAILKELGDEQSKTEAESLEKQIAMYEKQLNSSGSITQKANKAFYEQLSKHYQKQGYTAEEADNKSAKFFGNISSNAAIASEAINMLSTAFGGLDSGVDKILNDVGNVASAFAQGGIVGGVIAAAGIVVREIARIGKGDFDGYNNLVEHYEGLIDVWDQLISRKREYINIDYGAESQKAGQDVLDAIQKEIEAYRTLGKEKLNSGAGWWRSSVGVNQREDMSDEGWRQLQEAAKIAGFDYSSVASGRMTGLFDLTVEQLEVLQDKAPLFWSQLNGDVKAYLESIIESNSELEKTEQLINEALVGVSFDSFYDSFTSMLSNMESDTEDFADNFEKYLYNAIVSSIVANKYRKRIESLYESWADKFDSDNDGTQDLIESEIAILRKEQEALAADMIAERDALINAMGFDSSYSQEASSKGFKSMSQETADELNGRFTALQIAGEAIRVNTDRIVSLLSSAQSGKTELENISDIEATMLQTINYNISISNSYLEDITAYTKNLKEMLLIANSISAKLDRL